MSNPSVMIATPAFGGLLYVSYVESLQKTYDYCGEQGIPLGTYFISNESLITRGRNACVTAALSAGIDKLIFIDADVGWEAADFARLYWSEREIVGGFYPHKTYPIQMNFNPLLRGDEGLDEAWPEFAKRADAAGEVEVAHMATGFLKIDCSVFRKLQPYCLPYVSSHMRGVPQTYADFFTVGASASGSYLSEDWAFCELARKYGYGIWGSVNTVLSHTGTHTFRAR